jgi:hypothetical protein
MDFPDRRSSSPEVSGNNLQTSGISNLNYLYLLKKATFTVLSTETCLAERS